MAEKPLVTNGANLIWHYLVFTATDKFNRACFMLL